MKLLEYGKWTVIQYTDYSYWPIKSQWDSNFDLIRGIVPKEEILRLYPQARIMTYVNHGAVAWRRRILSSAEEDD